MTIFLSIDRSAIRSAVGMRFSPAVEWPEMAESGELPFLSHTINLYDIGQATRLTTATLIDLAGSFLAAGRLPSLGHELSTA